MPVPLSCNPVPLNPTKMELSLRHYFVTKAIVNVSDEFNSDLWSYFLPQAAQNFEPIWHAGNAVAAASWATNGHTDLTLDVADKLDTESVKQYSISTKRVLAMTQKSGLTPQERATILLASVLYSVYAGRRSEAAHFVKLREMNRNLILHWKFWEYTDSTPVSGLAMHLMYHYVKGTSGFHGTLFPAPSNAPGAWLGAIRWFQKRPVASLLQGQIEIELLWISINDIMAGLPFYATAHDVEVIRSKRALLKRHLTVWEERCIDLAFKLPPTSNLQVGILQIQRILIHVYFTLDIDRCTNLWDETIWDVFEPEFATVVELCSALLLPDQSVISKPPPNVSQSAHLLRLLETTIRACREPALRRKASVLQEYCHYFHTDHLPKVDVDFSKLPNYMITSRVILLEEIAWRDEAAQADCDQAKSCVRDEFICNNHRVIRVMDGPSSRLTEEYTLITVGDIIYDRLGTKEIIVYDDE